MSQQIRQALTFQRNWPNTLQWDVHNAIFFFFRSPFLFPLPPPSTSKLKASSILVGLTSQEALDSCINTNYKLLTQHSLQTLFIHSIINKSLFSSRLTNIYHIASNERNESVLLFHFFHSSNLQYYGSSFHGAQKHQKARRYSKEKPTSCPLFIQIIAYQS